MSNDLIDKVTASPINANPITTEKRNTILIDIPPADSYLLYALKCMEYAQKAQKWAESATSPDNQTDTESPTGKTQSAKEWANAAKEWAEQANVLTVNDIPVSNKNIYINRKFFNSIEQLGLEKATVTPEQILKAMPANSTVAFYASSIVDNFYYTPGLNLPFSVYIIVDKANNDQEGATFIGTPVNAQDIYPMIYGRCTANSNYQFFGWHQYQQRIVGTILPYAGDTLPFRSLWCDGSAISRTTYADLYSVTGTKYGAGNGSTTFNLPNLNDNRFIEFASVAGTKKDAGLPDITAGIGLYNSMQLFGATAWKGTGVSDTQNSVGGSNQAKNSGYIDFSAKRANSIYGNATTVQPKSLTLRAIIFY